MWAAAGGVGMVNCVCCELGVEKLEDTAELSEDGSSLDVEATDWACFVGPVVGAGVGSAGTGGEAAVFASCLREICETT